MIAVWHPGGVARSRDGEGGHDAAMRTTLCLATLLLLAGCGESRPTARVGGDPGGAPVTLTAHYDRDALAALAQGSGFTRTVVVERDAWGDPFWPRYGYHHYRYHRPWPGPAYAYEPSTALSLLVGDGPAEAQLLRARLTPGANSWTVPMRPGREAVVSLQADGGREGWREIGRFTAAPGQRVTVHLAGAQPRLEVESAEPGPASTPPATATEPAAPTPPAAAAEPTPTPASP